MSMAEPKEGSKQRRRRGDRSENKSASFAKSWSLASSVVEQTTKKTNLIEQASAVKFELEKENASKKKMVKFGTEIIGNGPYEPAGAVVPASTSNGDSSHFENIDMLSDNCLSSNGTGSGKRMSRKERQEKKLRELKAKQNSENHIPGSGQPRQDSSDEKVKLPKHSFKGQTGLKRAET